MPRRYYLSPIVGTGTPDDPYRAKAADTGLNHVAVIPVDPTTGIPTSIWALVCVAAVDHAPVAGDPAVTALPDMGLDTPLSSISGARRNALFTQMDLRQVDRTGVTTATPFREVLRRIGRRLEGGFDPAHFGVAEPGA